MIVLLSVVAFYAVCCSAAARPHTISRLAGDIELLLALPELQRTAQRGTIPVNVDAAAAGL
jgi:hypothetical protein